MREGGTGNFRQNRAQEFVAEIWHEDFRQQTGRRIFAKIRHEELLPKSVTEERREEEEEEGGQEGGGKRREEEGRGERGRWMREVIGTTKKRINNWRREEGGIEERRED